MMSTSLADREVAEAWQSAREAIDWARLGEPAVTALEERTGDLQDSLRNWALLPASVLRAAVSAARKPSEVPLTPVEASQIGMVWRVARRLAAGWNLGGLDPDPLDASATAPAAAAGPGPSGWTASTGPGAPIVAGRKVKLSQVLDQSDESEVPAAGPERLKTWHANWRTFAKGPPEEEAEPSGDQRAALDTRVRIHGEAPYCDFAVFTPFSRKAARSHTFTAHLPQPDGTWLAKEIPGPRNLEAWQYCFAVIRVCCILLDIIPEVALTKYRG